MTTVVELGVPAGRLAFARTFDRVPEFEFRIGGLIGDAAPLVWISGASGSAVASALEDDPSVEVVARLTETGDRRLYRLTFDRPVKLFQRLVAAHAGAILEAGGRDGSWSLSLLFHDREALSEAHGLLERYGFDPTVTRVTSMDGVRSDGSPLTETQYETVATAYERGYFDVPRKVTLKELAAELDVSHQALSERLRRSHAALVDAELSTQLAPTRIDP